jgi:hypothetical protein
MKRRYTSWRQYKGLVFTAQRVTVPYIKQQDIRTQPSLLRQSILVIPRCLRNSLTAYSVECEDAELEGMRKVRDVILSSLLTETCPQS